MPRENYPGCRVDGKVIRNPEDSSAAVSQGIAGSIRRGNAAGRPGVFRTGRKHKHY